MSQQDLIDKMRKFAMDHKNCCLVTVGPGGYPRARVMEALPVSGDNTIWFATYASSRKVSDIKANSRVSVLFMDPAEGDLLAVFGEARTVNDGASRKRFWKDNWTDYFPGGVDDPEFVLLAISPVSAEFHDAKEHKRYDVP